MTRTRVLSEKDVVVKLITTITKPALVALIYDNNRVSAISDFRSRQRKFDAYPAQCISAGEDGPYSLAGNLCCDSSIPRIIDKQLTATDGIGAISRTIQDRIQSRFNRTFEVVISASDFVINTYYAGPQQCKFETDLYFVALYETPVQYDLFDANTETFLASFNSRDPLGWKQAPLAQLDEDHLEATALAPPTNTARPTRSSHFNSTLTYSPAFRLPEAAFPGCWRESFLPDPNVPYLFSSEECCDAHLDGLMREVALRFENAPHLGDTAKIIQRRLQLVYKKSFEVIMSKANFAISSYYQGHSSCKVHEGGYYYLAYQTPVQYDIFDHVRENYLASIDAEEPLGAIKPANTRGELPDVRMEPSAGDDLSIQPDVHEARALLYESAGADEKTANRVLNALELNDNAFEEEDDFATATSIGGFHVGGNRSFGDVMSWDKRRLPFGTHCNKKDRTGDKCCSGALFETMSDAFYELSSSPKFATTSAGNIASLIQKRAQLRFKQSFEVIVSTSNFSIASYGFGDQTCKYKERGFTVIAYATPIQYDISDKEAEEYYASVSSQDELGATQPSLPGQRPFHTLLRTYDRGDREGFPVGSHCGAERAGSRCCSLDLFTSMQRSYNELIRRDDFDPYDLRRIARALQYNAEGDLGHSVEVIVSTDDFAISSAYSGDNTCKYRVDRYYLMTYASPKQYPLYTDIHEDSGPAVFLDCPQTLEELDGEVCCDGTLQYEITHAIAEAKQNRSRANPRAMTAAVSGRVQKRFGTTFETVVSKSDFTWRTHRYSRHTCKIDSQGYHALAYETNKARYVEPEGDGGEQAFEKESQPSLRKGKGRAKAYQANILGANLPVLVTQQYAVDVVEQNYEVTYPVLQYDYCFSTDTWVTTPEGKKRMDELQVGDYVLTANLTAAYFSPVTLWMHREPDVTTNFVTIMTEYGKMLALTPGHLIFRTECEEFYDDSVNELPANREAVYAEQLRVGDCVYLLYKDGFRKQKLQDISITQRRGVYSPLTLNGRIIVNDMLASCYSDVNHPLLQTSYFMLLDDIRKEISALFGSWSDSWLNQMIDRPFGSQISKEMFKLIMPYASL
ncbi:unnamed protein product [Cylicocyclus nassatus]|uniref:Uncharacterized protein n=1 Tax=Cylicocyclus nassatus TaxID=53992 RepID=A0AA36GD81_CYLNA|nr:unnamed protein product [Cylicocyclus nassatus]